MHRRPNCLFVAGARSPRGGRVRFGSRQRLRWTDHTRRHVAIAHNDGADIPETSPRSSRPGCSRLDVVRGHCRFYRTSRAGVANADRIDRRRSDRQGEVRRHRNGNTWVERRNSTTNSGPHLHDVLHRQHGAWRSSAASQPEGVRPEGGQSAALDNDPAATAAVVRRSAALRQSASPLKRRISYSIRNAVTGSTRAACHAGANAATAATPSSNTATTTITPGSLGLIP
jgi:hypothetical protein